MRTLKKVVTLEQLKNLASIFPKTTIMELVEWIELEEKEAAKND